MAVLRAFAMFAAVAASATALAQPSEPAPRNNAIVYKCVNAADGSVVYSDSACSADPKKVQTIDTSGALRTGSGGHQDDIAASVADSDCRSKAFETTHAGYDAKMAESNAHIAEYRKRGETLRAQMNIGGAAVDQSLRQQLDELDAAIAKESEFQQTEASNTTAAYDNALKACDNAQKKSGEKVHP